LKPLAFGERGTYNPANRKKGYPYRTGASFSAAPAGKRAFQRGLEIKSSERNAVAASGLESVCQELFSEHSRSHTR
jgi:hypothetical protein